MSDRLPCVLFNEGSASGKINAVHRSVTWSGDVIHHLTSTPLPFVV